MSKLWRRAGLVLAVLMTPFVPAAVPAAPSNLEVRDVPVVREAPDGGAALAAARRQGSDVVVGAMTTPTRLVKAHPDGTMSAELTVTPVRVSRGGAWADVDTTLVRRADGTVGPRSATVDMTFSGGGAQPLVKLAAAGGFVALGWPAQLPEPLLDGPVATYQDVLPGVDLTLRAEATGYVKHFVVRTPEAARQPALSRIRLSVASHLLSLKVAKDGGTEIRDAAGQVVMSGPPSVMWDHAVGQGHAPGAGARSAPVRVVAGKGEIQLVPDAALLRDPKTRFPVVIDPSEHTAGRHAWAKVFSGFPNDKYWFGGIDGGEGKVGACPSLYGGDCRGIGVARTYWLYDTSFLANRSVVESRFTVGVIGGADCVSRGQVLYRAHGNIWDGMTYNSRPGGDAVSSIGVGCGGDAVFNPGGNVNLGGQTSYWIQAATEANDRDGQLYWRKYSPDSARLYVKFNAAPNWPNDVRILEGLPAACKWCEGKPYVGVDWLTLQAYLTDVDGDEVTAWWDVYDAAGLHPVRDWAPLRSGNWHSLSLDLRARHGQQIDWYVKARDSSGAQSEWRQGWAPFVVDRVGVPNKPLVSSRVYPADNRWHGGTTVPGDFTFSANGVADVDHYLYDWNGAPHLKVDATALGGGATVTLPVPGDGPRELSVQSVDRAGNRSPVTVYRFYVRAGNGPLAQWSLEGDAKDSAYLGWRDGTLYGGATYAPGAVGTGVRLDGVDDRVAVQNGVRTDVSFSVSAWAKIDHLNSEHATVVSQSGSNFPVYALQYEKSSQRWVFVTPHSDEATPSGYSFVRSAGAPVPGEWTHLAGVYDAAQGRISLYVNGVLAGSVGRAAAVAWHGNGYFRVGYQAVGVEFKHFFPGMVDEVKLYDRVLSADEVRSEVSRDNVQLGYWKFDDEPQSTTAANTVPGGAAGVLHGNAALAPGQVNGAVKLSGGDDHVSMGGPVLRTDQSFTVAAWLKADRTPEPGHTFTAVSQDGQVNSGFFLGYRNLDGGRWELYVPSADAGPGRPVDAVVHSGPNSAVAGTAAHVAAVYDAPAKQIRLYVDGAQVGTAAVTSAFHATGAFRVGGGLWEGHLAATPGGAPWTSCAPTAGCWRSRSCRAWSAGTRWRGRGGRSTAASPRRRPGSPAATPGTGWSTPAASRRCRRRTIWRSSSTASPPTSARITRWTPGAASRWRRGRGWTASAATRRVVSQDGARISPFQLQATPSGHWAFGGFGNDNENDARDRRLIGPAVQVGAWTHLVATYNAVARRTELYVNGVLAGSMSDVTMFRHAGELQIGASKWAGARLDLFPGAIDDVSVWTRPLFAEEIKVMAGRDLSLAHQWKLDEPSGAGTADAVGARSAVLSGDAAFTPGRVGNGVRFDGDGDAVTTSGVDIRTDKAFTVMAWVKLASADCDLSQVVSCATVAVSADGGATSGTSKFRLGHYVDSDQYQWGAWYFELPEADGTVTKASLATRLEEVGRWVHLTGVYDPATRLVVLYVNAERHDEGTLNEPWQGTGGLAIGRGRAGGEPSGLLGRRCGRRAALHGGAGQAAHP